ncbi:MAG: hypothetical protein H7Y31_13580 [Chitinophagaceae bacterium]|nr:hypothetical protein [Chitinophagaceae bacterium]
MEYNDIIGTIGVGLILLAYFCSTFKILPAEGRVFFMLNILGAGLACYASYLINYWPFVILEAVWCLVSMIGLFRRSQHKLT